MGETTSQIRQEVLAARSRLGQDLNELEYRVKRNADWRVQYARHPWVILGIVFGASALLGMAAMRRV